MLLTPMLYKYPPLYTWKALFPFSVSLIPYQHYTDIVTLYSLVIGEIFPCHSSFPSLFDDSDASILPHKLLDPFMKLKNRET